MKSAAPWLLRRPSRPTSPSLRASPLLGIPHEWRGRHFSIKKNGASYPEKMGLKNGAFWNGEVIRCLLVKTIFWNGEIEQISYDIPSMWDPNSAIDPLLNHGFIWVVSFLGGRDSLSHGFDPPHLFFLDDLGQSWPKKWDGHDGLHKKTPETLWRGLSFWPWDPGRCRIFWSTMGWLLFFWIPMGAVEKL